jgi:hypothetical protein
VGLRFRTGVSYSKRIGGRRGKNPRGCLGVVATAIVVILAILIIISVII